jgi:uncharacterized membrane protein YkvA (DUF1232 family)
MDPGSIVVVVLGVLVLWALLLAILWVFRPRDVRLRDLAGVVPDLLRLVRDLIADRSVPLRVRVVLVGLLAWLVSPIDLIPEFIPILGPLDDLIVSVIVLRYVRRRLGDIELRRRWRGTPQSYDLLEAILG